MPFVVPSVGEVVLLELIRGNMLNLGGGIFLFKNDYTPDNDTILTDFTEADFTGYASQAIPATWALTTVIAGRAFTSNAPMVFLCTGGATPNNIYGYWITDGSGNLIFAERFASAPLVMDTAGQTISVTPSVTLSSES